MDLKVYVDDLQPSIDASVQRANGTHFLGTVSGFAPMGLHGIFRRPFPRSAIVPSFVSFEKLGNVWDQRVIGVGVSEQTTNGKQNLTNGQGWTPLVLQNIQTNTSIRVDVAVVDASSEMNLWRLERIVRRKVDIEEENATSIGRVVGSHDRCLPVEHVITNWTSRTVGRRIFSQIDQFYGCKLRDHEQASTSSKEA
jgi:hypothetical protein